MEQNITTIQNDISEIKAALLGNKISGEKGIVGKIVELEEQLEEQETKIELLLEEKTKITVYIKIITWIMAAIGTGILGFIVKQIMEK